MRTTRRDTTASTSREPTDAEIDQDIDDILAGRVIDPAVLSAGNLEWLADHNAAVLGRTAPAEATRPSSRRRERQPAGLPGMQETETQQ